MNKKPYSVISVQSDGQINMDHVMAVNPANAIGIVARRKERRHRDDEYVAVLSGHVVDGDDNGAVYFPGMATVYTEGAVVIDKG